MEDQQNPKIIAELVQMTRAMPSGGDYLSGIPSSATVPAVLDVPQAARLLGIGRTLAYELVRTNQWPTPVIRVGRLIKIPSGPLIELMTTGASSGRLAAG